MMNPLNYQPYPIYNQQPQQIQNSGFISVRNIEEAQNYPIAPGNSITFKDETAPYVYTKTMGFSQLDRPVFEKYRLVKEADVRPAPKEKVDYVLKSDLDAINSEIKSLKEEISALREDVGV